ncbi:hypothetical protein KDL67_15590, partial [bacterium]|nr:hypothetical protein [bacterium]
MLNLTGERPGAPACIGGAAVAASAQSRRTAPVAQTLSGEPGMGFHSTRGTMAISIWVVALLTV